MALTPEQTQTQIDRMAQIGNVCIQWANLEYHLAQSIWIMLGLSTELGKTVTGGLDMRPRIAMAIELAGQTHAPEQFCDELRKVRDAVDGGLLKLRNRVIHGTHFNDSSFGLSLEVHRGRDKTRRPITDDDLRKLGRDIHTVATSFHVALGAFATILCQMASTRSEADSQPGS